MALGLPHCSILHHPYCPYTLGPRLIKSGTMEKSPISSLILDPYLHL